MPHVYMGRMKQAALFFSGLLLLAAEFLAGQPVFPPSLKKGDCIAVILPASAPEEESQESAQFIKSLRDKGYRIKIPKNFHSRHGYLAGADPDRAKALMEAWQDNEVKAIWCYRGGYGSSRILDKLDFNLIRKNPKIFIGMSDATALHAAFIKEAGLVTFLGPNLNAVFGSGNYEKAYNEQELWKMIGEKPGLSVRNQVFAAPKTFPPSTTLRPGIAKGRLAGGTLSLIVSLLGTPWEIDTEGKILVLEEVDEEPYRIDRMLCQLKLAGKLNRLAGAVLCTWKGCSSKRPERSLSLERIFKDYFEKASYPVLIGFPSGHVPGQTTLPLNALSELDASKKTLRLLEKPVL